MPNYVITINGKKYDIQVEKKEGVPVIQQSPLSFSVPEKVVTPPPCGTGESGKKIVAPMPGKVVSINVNVGDTVKKGQELMVVEAMKMNNPILASSAGVIREIYVNPGEPVQTGTPLLAVG